VHSIINLYARQMIRILKQTVNNFDWKLANYSLATTTPFNFIKLVLSVNLFESLSELAISYDDAIIGRGGSYIYIYGERKESVRKTWCK